MVSAIVFFYIFSILGVSLWHGDIYYRWYETPEPVAGNWTVIESDHKLWGARSWETGYWRSLVKQYDDHPSTLDLDIVGR